MVDLSRFHPFLLYSSSLPGLLSLLAAACASWIAPSSLLRPRSTSRPDRTNVIALLPRFHFSIDQTHAILTPSRRIFRKINPTKQRQQRRTSSECSRKVWLGSSIPTVVIDPGQYSMLDISYVGHISRLGHVFSRHARSQTQEFFTANDDGAQVTSVSTGLSPDLFAQMTSSTCINRFSRLPYFRVFLA